MSKTFLESISGQYIQDPEKTWLTLFHNETEESFSYNDLHARVNDYCSFYRSLELGQGELVVIILKESLDLFASFLAGIISGLRPAYYFYPSPKQSAENFRSSVEHLASYNSIGLVVTFPEVSGLLSEHERLRCPVRTVEDVGQTTTDYISGMNPGQVVEGFLQFSSGTTGAKKGVEITGTDFFNQEKAYVPFLDFDESSKVITWLPHYHDMGLIACMLIPFVSGIPIIMMSPFEWVANPRMLLDLISEKKATHLWLPNFALGLLSRTVDREKAGDYDLSSVRSLVCCSEPLLQETIKEFIEKFSGASLAPEAINNCYAMAENTFAMTTTTGRNLRFVDVADLETAATGIEERSRFRSPPVASVGKPLPNISIKIQDETGNDAAENKIGKIVIKSDCMLAGYHNNQEATRDAFRDGYFRTGDLGFFNEGELFVLGREKDVIIVAGENIYAYDVELALNEIDGLVPGRNVVFGITDDDGDTGRLVAMAESKLDLGELDPGKIKSQVFLKSNCVISELIILPHMSLKKGTAGKISRALNREAYLAGDFHDRRERQVPAGSDKDLRAVIETQFPHIDLRKDRNTGLFSAGLLDSLGFATLVSEIERLFSISVPNDYLKYEYFDDLDTIQDTVEKIIGNVGAESRDLLQERQASLDALLQDSLKDAKAPFWEKLINHFPLKGSFFYRLLFRLAGISIGKNVRFLGRPRVKLRGKPENITIGDDVILGDGIDLRNRENGKIILENRVYCDNHVRLVAAREGKILLGTGTEIGAHSVINSGGEVITGKYCMIAGNVNINSSSHGTRRSSYIKSQPHDHGKVELGDDVWIGGNASILINTTIGEGAIISANSTASGNFPPFSVSLGNPATILKYRD